MVAGGWNTTVETSMEETDWTAFELMWQLENKEISLPQFKAQCKDLGWTEDEIEECLDGYGEDDDDSF